MSRGKEILLQEDDRFLIKIGTIDNKDPKSIFLTISSWTRPKKEEDNYERIVSNLRKRIKQRIFDEGDSSIFDPFRTIVDLDLRSSGISTSKKSFMFCEVTMFQNEIKLPIRSEHVLNYFKNISNNLIKDVFNEDSLFEFNKTKNGDQ
jgi:hypothetical protein